jgi:hypothetical protein
LRRASRIIRMPVNPHDGKNNNLGAMVWPGGAVRADPACRRIGWKLKDRAHGLSLRHRRESV